MYTFVIETTDKLTGHLFHEASQIPVQYEDADIIMTTLGIGDVQGGVIRTITKDQVNKRELAAFLAESNRLIQADNHRLAA